jgi:hypothetical protein
MAVLAFLFGTLIGAFCGITGWLYFDMNVLASLGVYLMTSMGIGMAVILRALQTQDPPTGSWTADAVNSRNRSGELRRRMHVDSLVFFDHRSQREK